MELQEISLEDIKDNEELISQYSDVYIWSGEWKAYWMEKSNGYTYKELEAGVYSIDEALKLSGHCGKDKKISYIPIAKRHRDPKQIIEDLEESMFLGQEIDESILDTLSELKEAYLHYK